MNLPSSSESYLTAGAMMESLMEVIPHLTKRDNCDHDRR